MADPYHRFTISMDKLIFTNLGALFPRSFKNTLPGKQNMVALSLYNGSPPNRLTALRKVAYSSNRRPICSETLEVKEQVEGCPEIPTTCVFSWVQVKRERSADMAPGSTRNDKKR